jgi:hypothetical protein
MDTIRDGILKSIATSPTNSELINYCKHTMALRPSYQYNIIFLRQYILGKVGLIIFLGWQVYNSLTASVKLLTSEGLRHVIGDHVVVGRAGFCLFLSALDQICDVNISM